MGLKSKLKRIVKCIYDKRERFVVIDHFHGYDFMEDEKYLVKKFDALMRRRLNLNEPLTYNEKLQFIKLFDHNPMYTTMVDKVAVKEQIASVIGEKYIIPTIGVWENVDEIDFNKFPKKFVIKCNHNSGMGMYICKDKDCMDIGRVKKNLKKGLMQDYYITAREWPYKDVKRKIIAEEYIGEVDKLPEDYKFYTFNGKIDSVMVCKDRDKGYPTFFFYDMDWNRLSYQNVEPELEEELKKPNNFEEMKCLVEKIAGMFYQARIDLYNIKGKIYFGEITFFNQSGYDRDISYETDLMWGEKLNIPKKLTGGK